MCRHTEQRTAMNEGKVACRGKNSFDIGFGRFAMMLTLQLIQLRKSHLELPR